MSVAELGRAPEGTRQSGGAAPALNVWNLDIFNPVAVREREEMDRRDQYTKRKAAAPAAINLQAMTSNLALAGGALAADELKDAGDAPEAQ